MDEAYIEKMKKLPIEFLCGRYAWILADIEALEEPFFAKGQLGIWNYDLASDKTNNHEYHS